MRHLSIPVIVAILLLPAAAMAQGLFGNPPPPPPPQTGAWGSPPTPPSPASAQAAPSQPAEPKITSLNLNSDPPGATIIIDGNAMGKTPTSLKGVDPGEHVLRLSKDGYVDAETTVTLSPGETRNIKMTLEELAETREKRLRYQSAQDRYEAAMEEYREVSAPKKIWGFSLLGAGVACGVTATVLYVIGFGRAGDNYDKYSTTVNQEKMNTYWDEVKSGETLVTVGHVMAASTAVLIGGSLFFFLTIPSKPVEPKFGALIPQPSLMNGMPVLTWSGSW